jgi:cell division protein FtsZ
MTASTDTFSSSNAPVRFVGFGGAGCNVAELLYKKGLAGKFTCISHPVRTYPSEDIQFIHFIPPGEPIYHQGEEIFRRHDPDHPLDVPAAIEEIFDRSSRYVLIAGLGGFTGTTMTEKFVLQLHVRKIPFLAIASVPFEFEGAKRNHAARAALDKLLDVPGFHHVELQSFASGNGHLTLSEAFAKADAGMAEMAEWCMDGLW